MPKHTSLSSDPPSQVYSGGTPNRGLSMFVVIDDESEALNVLDVMLEAVIMDTDVVLLVS
jgi:hypothetical protein